MNDINKKIELLEKELAELKYERDNTAGIKPSETKLLIEQLHGKCFLFSGYEYGSVELMLNTIYVDRVNKTIKINGEFIIYSTPDSDLITPSNNDLWVCGGTLLCKGSVNINEIPYVNINWNEPLYKQLSNVFSKDREITLSTFLADVQKVDEYADTFGDIEPISEINKEPNSYEYKKLYKHL